MSSLHESTPNRATIKTEADKPSSSGLMKIGIICALVIGIGFIATFFFDVPFGTLLFAAMALACPLLHIFMMRSGNHKH